MQYKLSYIFDCIFMFCDRKRNPLSKKVVFLLSNSKNNNNSKKVRSVCKEFTNRHTPNCQLLHNILIKITTKRLFEKLYTNKHIRAEWMYGGGGIELIFSTRLS